MDKQKFIQKAIACRVLAGDLLADAYDLDDKTDCANGLYYAHEILDAIDTLLNDLQSEEENQNEIH